MQPIDPTCRYDWFSASFDYEPAELVSGYATALKAEPRNVRALNGYQRAVGMFWGDDEQVRVQWSDTGRPNILATGFPSQRVFEIAKERFPSYSLARGDVCVDFDDEDIFEVAHAAMRRLSHERGVKHHIRGDWETPGSPDGRTTYAGALGKSVVVRRLYEFAKCHGYGMPVRFELEIKPHSKAKHRYACLDAIELFKSDGYAVEFLRRLGYSVERMVITRDPPPQFRAWFAHLAKQYGAKLSEYVARELNGDSSRLGPALIAAYESEVDHRRQIARAAAANSAWSSLARGCQPLATNVSLGHQPPLETSDSDDQRKQDDYSGRSA